MAALWATLTEPWRVCVEQAWEAYLHGSLPIGACVADSNGRVVARGRNRLCEPGQPAGAAVVIAGNRLAHAEVNALLAVYWAMTDPATCAVYTTTEPCPFCVGAIRMCRVSAVHFASRDGAGGSADLFTANNFLRRGEVSVHPPQNDDLETLLVAVLIAYGLQRGTTNDMQTVSRHGERVPAALRLGTSLHQTGLLRECAKRAAPTSEVVEAVEVMMAAQRVPGSGE